MDREPTARGRPPDTIHQPEWADGGADFEGVGPVQPGTFSLGSMSPGLDTVFDRVQD